MRISPQQPARNDAVRQQQFAIRLSLAVGVLMLIGKVYAYLITGSAAILSDAAESVVHVGAVGFAAFSLWFSMQPADAKHPYGHDKIGYFSAGVEGVLIVMAAVYIIYEAVAKWIAGLELQNLGSGMLFVAGAAAINGGLGGFLVWQGRKHNSLILVANGKHVLTDSWTSFGVIVGLLMVLWTGVRPFDPILAILVALNILWSGGKLMRQSIGGLMDEVDPIVQQEIENILDRETENRGLGYHQLRHRNSGNAIWVDVHLLFPATTSIEEAHWRATEIEAALKSGLRSAVTVTTHLEPSERHEDAHHQLKRSKE